ncbi:MAG: methylmalonyl-CoA mutase family protein [Thermoanaerobaculia bacterium]
MGIDPVETIGIPGEYSYTRGIHPTGYRGKLWTMRRHGGGDTNQRLKYLLAQRQRGHGYDSEHSCPGARSRRSGIAQLAPSRGRRR